MITTLDRYPLQPGLLVTWRLRPAGRAPIADRRPPSYLQEEHLRAAALSRRKGQARPSWLGTAFDLPGGCRIEDLQKTLLAFVGRHESLRSGFQFHGDHLTRFTHPASDIELCPTVVGEFGHGGHLAAYLEPLIDEATDPLETLLPSLFVAVIGKDATTMLMASDHSRTDGYSLFLAPHELHQLYAATVAGVEAAELAEAGSHADFSRSERHRGAEIGADHPGVLIWKDFLANSGGRLPEFPLPRGVRPGTLPDWAGLHEQVMTSVETDAFDAATRRCGGRFLSGLVAANAVAARELSGDEQFRTTVPVHTRTHGKWVASIGWYVNSLPVRVPMTGVRDFADAVEATALAMRRALPAVRVPCSRAWELTGTLPLLRNMISLMDLRATPGNARWKDWHVSGLGKPPPGDNSFFWFLRTHGGLSATAVFPETGLARHNTTRYVARVGEILSAVARTGNYDIALNAISV